MKALVVHGSAPERAVCSAQLTWLGVEFETASTVDEALALLDGGEFDVVLLAWELIGSGEGGALELLRQVRAEERWTSLPVLILTSSNDVASVEQAFDAGANEFLVQPSEADALLEKLLVLGLDPEPVREMRVVPRPRPAADPSAAPAAQSPEDPEARRAA